MYSVASNTLMQYARVIEQVMNIQCTVQTSTWVPIHGGSAYPVAPLVSTVPTAA